MSCRSGKKGEGRDPTERTGLAVLRRAAEGTCWWGIEQIDGFLSWRNCALLKNHHHRGATTLPSPKMHTDPMENARFTAWLDLGRGGSNYHSQT